MDPHHAPQHQRDSLLTTRQVAELLRMSREQVWRLHNTGRLAAYRFDRLLRFSRADVERFMVDHYRETGAPAAWAAAPSSDASRDGRRRPRPPAVSEYRPL
jgi:excisionase family DNA binding protein